MLEKFKEQIYCFVENWYLKYSIAKLHKQEKFRRRLAQILYDKKLWFLNKKVVE